MTLDQCITILTEHNKWRRGQGEYEHAGARFPFESAVLGEAIDCAVETLPALYGTIKSVKQTKDAMVKKLQKQKLLLRDAEDVFARCEGLANTRFSPSASFIKEMVKLRKKIEGLEK